MNELLLLGTEITMTSLEVVELINNLREEEGNTTIKEHKTLMRDIRNEIETLVKSGIKAEYNFVPGSYLDKNNQERPCYKMNKAGIMQILNKESALVRYKTQQYIEALERALSDLKFRQGDKKHQLECMEKLQGILPEEYKQEKLSYIKANTVVNKCVSNVYGFPKMLKKDEMNKEMLDLREQVLDYYIKLYDVLQDNTSVRDALYRKYKQRQLG